MNADRQLNREPRALRPAKGGTTDQSASGFTLIELMVVMLIIGVLASITVPALKGLGQANRSSAAHRQILDDLGLARLRAINDRSPVYMVFVPTNAALALARARTAMPTPQGKAERTRLTNLLTGQFSSYALIALRSVGDQPGQHHPRYLTEWRSLPEGILLAPYKLVGNNVSAQDAYSRALRTAFLPFPSSGSEEFPLPYIGFNAQGQLISQRDEILPLAKGSVFVLKSPNGAINLDVQLNPAPAPRTAASPAFQTNTYQFVRINWLTGRAKVELPEFRQ